MSLQPSSCWWRRLLSHVSSTVPTNVLMPRDSSSFFSHLASVSDTNVRQLTKISNSWCITRMQNTYDHNTLSKSKSKKDTHQESPIKEGPQCVGNCQSTLSTKGKCYPCMHACLCFHGGKHQVKSAAVCAAPPCSAIENLTLHFGCITNVRFKQRTRKRMSMQGLILTFMLLHLLWFLFKV